MLKLEHREAIATGRPTEPGVSTPVRSSVRGGDRALISLFCLAILSIAGATWVLTPSQKSADENRNLAPLPVLSAATLPDFPQQFEAYYNDRLAFKPLLVQLRSIIKYLCWGTSGSAQVGVGNDGFLFLLGSRMDWICKSESPFSPAQLEQWQAALKLRSDRLSRQGISYFFVVAPEKPSIYPDLVPASLRPVRVRSGIDQLEACAYGKFQFLNLKPALRAARKSAGQVYFRTDTHWNDEGAYSAYREIVLRLREKFPQVPVPLSHAQFSSSRQESSGDLSRLMGLSGWLKEENASLSPRVLDGLPGGSIDLGAEKVFVEQSAATDKHLPRVLVVHDSFGTKLRPLLPRHFSAVCFLRKFSVDGAFELDQNLIDTFKPDIVIHLLVERHVMNTDPEPEALKERFAAGAPIKLDRQSEWMLTGCKFLLPPESAVARLDAYQLDPQIALPNLPPSRSHKRIVRLVFDSPSASRLQIFYSFDTNSAFAQDRSIIRTTARGKNEFLLEIPEGVVAWRLDPGDTNGVYTIYQLDCRDEGE